MTRMWGDMTTDAQPTAPVVGSQPKDDVRIGWPIMLLLWAVAVGASYLVRATLSGDPDDHMRLTQVLDWMHGQSWFDVTQYRINPPDGFLMHWTRFLDVPMAAIIAVLRPFVGEHAAAQAMLYIYPALLMLAYLWLVQRLSRALFPGNRTLALLSMAVASMMWLCVLQFTAGRIDHHGVQMLIGLAMTERLVRAPTLVTAAVAAILGAFYLHVSLEGLPFVLGAAVLLGWRWLWHGEDAGPMQMYALCLAIAGVAFQLAARGPAGLADTGCDMFAEPYLFALTSASMTLWAWTRIAGGRTLYDRLLAVAVTGTMGVLWLALSNPACLNGPFAALDPFVHEMWYSAVLEGLPVWQAYPEIAAMAVLTTPFAMVGAWFAARQDRTVESATLYRYLLLVAVATAVGLMVVRANYVAQAIAVPPLAWLLHRAWNEARAIANPTRRIVASVATMFIVPAISLSTIYAVGNAIMPSDRDEDPADARSPLTGGCITDVLNKLPATTLFAPLDMGPEIISTTPHSVMGSGYHRNNDAIARNFRAMMSPDAKAEQIIRATPATHVVLCQSASENEHLRNAARAAGEKQPLTRLLEENRAPAWLEFVPSASDKYVRVWKIRPSK